MNSLENFNKSLENFLKNLIENYPEIEKHLNDYYTFPLEGTKYIEHFSENCVNKGQDISTKNEIIFSEEIEILRDVEFNKIWNDDALDDVGKENIWKNLHTLYLYSYEYQKDKSVKSILEELKNVQSDNENIDEQTKTFLNIIESLTNIKEDFYLLILLLFVLIVIYIFFNNIYGFSSILFAVLSSLSNIGLGLDTQFSNLSILFLILVIIGGASFSTSSGLKLIKLYAMFKFSLKEIYLIVKPLYISSNTLFLSKYKIKDEEINNYFLAIVFFIFSLFILSGILSFEQINFKDSLTLSILTITNTVNSNNYNLNEFYFSNINITSKISLMLFMIIGRVELLSFLILIKKFFFK